MIIVSQNKEIIINFDNIKTIRISYDNDYETSEEFWIINFDIEDVGHYQTRERAKEVLQEIMKRYTNWENFKAGQPEGICSPKYEMPEE